MGAGCVYHRRGLGPQRCGLVDGLGQLPGHLDARVLARLRHLDGLARVRGLDDVLTGDRVLHDVALRCLACVSPGEGQAEPVACLVVPGEGDARALRRDLDTAPADVLVGVVLALDEAEPVRLGRTGLVEDQTIPARVAQLLQHHLLLQQVQVAPERAGGHRVHLHAIHKLLGPVDGGGVVVSTRLALDEAVHHLLAGGGAVLDIDLAIDHRVTKVTQHHLTLRNRQALEACARSRGRSAAPVHGGRIVDPATCSEPADPALRGHGIGVQVPTAGIALVSERAGRDVLLRLGQVSETGGSRRRACGAPCHLCVAVVGHHALGERLHQLLARCSTVVEVLDLGGRGQGIVHHLLLRRSQ